LAETGARGTKIRSRKGTRVLEVDTFAQPIRIKAPRHTLMLFRLIQINDGGNRATTYWGSHGDRTHLLLILSASAFWLSIGSAYTPTNHSQHSFKSQRCGTSTPARTQTLIRTNSLTKTMGEVPLVSSILNGTQAVNTTEAMMVVHHICHGYSSSLEH